MPTTDEILDAARDLGKMVAEHEATKKLEAVVKRLQSDPETQRLLNDYNRHIQTLVEKESAGKPIEVADKQKLEQLKKNLTQSVALQQLQMAEMDYGDLMRKVREAIEGESLAAEAPTVAAPGGAGAGPAGRLVTPGT